MSAPPASTQSARLEPRSLLTWFQRNNVVALILLLLLFVAAVELLKPGTVNPVWLSNTLLFAAPLGILAAGQTMVMLTGGIDLSVVSVAMGSAFLMTIGLDALELLVAFLQAYVFAMLTCMYLNDALHPGH